MKKFFRIVAIVSGICCILNIYIDYTSPQINGIGAAFIAGLYAVGAMALSVRYKKING